LPLAQNKFINSLEKKLNRKLRAEPRGRRWIKPRRKNN